MGYFSNLPNIYVGEGVSDEESFKYRLVKNIFRRVKARDDLNRYTTLFESYSIRPGETPSTLANRIYGDPELDWCILLVNNIIDGGQVKNSGIYTAFGHHHIGLTGGPKTGRMVADMIAGKSANADLRPFEPRRFT